MTAFLPPRLPTDLVSRPVLEARLGPDSGASWTLVVGPPGAGKTTLVRSWLEGRHEPWTWIGITGAPHRKAAIVDLLVRGAQRAREPLPLDTLDSLDMDDGDAISVLAQLVDELAADPVDTPATVLVLDDAHLLDSDEWGPLRWLLDHLPPTLHPVVVSRSDPPIPLGRQRASGRMTEIRARDLGFELDETRQLLSATSGEPSLGVTEMLQSRTEGWAAGVRLAALAMRDGADPDELLSRFAGSNTSVAEFLLEEVLDHLPADRREFLLAAASLSILDPEICGAVTGRDDSALVLRGLASDGLFVSPVEHGCERYRFHPLLAELLQWQQRQLDPDVACNQHRRAAEWLVENDRAIDAIEHLLAAGDHARAHQLVVDWFRPLHVGSHRRDLDLWLAAIPDAVITESLERAVDHCVALCLIASPDGARWWTYCVDHGAADEPWPASRLECVQALYDGVRARLDDMQTHWQAARAVRPPGRTDEFDEVLATWEVRLEAHVGDPHYAVRRGRELVASVRQLLPDASALSVLAGALDAAGDHDSAIAVATRAIDRWRADGEPDLPGMVDALVVAAGSARRSGDLDVAEALLDTAASLPPQRSAAHLLVSIALIERARIDHARGGADWRGQLLGLAEELRIGGTPTDVVTWVDAARIELETSGAAGAAPSTASVVAAPPARPVAGVLVEDLTERELAVLPLLASHLTFPEIGAELYISRHTVKSHVTRIYRKLGVTSRSAAITEARQLGLLAPAG